MLNMGLDHEAGARAAPPKTVVKRPEYIPPQHVTTILLGELMEYAGRPMLKEQEGLFKKPEERDPMIFCSGDLNLKLKSISVIGARSASPEALMRASRVARELASEGIVVTSGLAKGVDTAAHTAAIKAGGRTVSVIGTPLESVYPAENAALQRDIYENHLLAAMEVLEEAGANVLFAIVCGKTVYECELKPYGRQEIEWVDEIHEYDGD